MRLTTEGAANVAFAIACVVLASLGVQRLLRDRPVAPPARTAAAVELIEGTKMSVSDSRRLGSDDARVALIEFSDFECPFCGRFSKETHKPLLDSFVSTGKVQYRFMHLPLEIHKFAVKAAESAECAGEQGKFWEMRERLFEHQASLSLANLILHAGQIGLEQEPFSRCLDGAMSARVQRQTNEATRLGIKSTPTFLLGYVDQDDVIDVRRRIVGAHPLEVFRKAIEDLLSARES
jgi:protein-disulfide isomerase